MPRSARLLAALFAPACGEPTCLVRVCVAPAVLAVASGALLAPAPARADGGWRWPVRGEVVERFALGSDPYVRGQHRGIDVAAPPGTSVRAACGGEVRFAGTAGSFGRAVTMACGRYVVSYGHLSGVAVARGDRVRVGAAIGRAGTSGRPSSPTPHLHLGVRRAGQAHGYVDPLLLLPAGAPASPPLGPGPRPTMRSPEPHRPPAPRPAPARRPGGSPAAARRVPDVRQAPERSLPRETVPAPVYVGLALLAAAVPGLLLLAPGGEERRWAALARAIRRRAAKARAAGP